MEHSSATKVYNVRFEVFTAVTMKNGITSQKTPFFKVYNVCFFSSVPSTRLFSHTLHTTLKFSSVKARKIHNRKLVYCSI
jgi:hypothetical protein